jgi:hypothetical protein
MAVSEIQVTSLGDLIDKVTPTEPNPITGRRRDVGVYRGSKHVSWPLLTSLDRLGGINPPHTKSGLEEHILRNFIRYSRPYFTPPVNEWELLIAAQHHGLPTRLLDWSYSPLVAAHFATADCHAAHDKSLDRLCGDSIGSRFIAPSVSRNWRFSFKTWINSLVNRGIFRRGSVQLQSTATHFACMLEPPSLDARIVAQSAAFTLCSDQTQPFDSFLQQKELGSSLTKFIIPAAEVQRFRDQLDLVAIDERRLFPDLDGVAAELQRYYS